MHCVKPREICVNVYNDLNLPTELRTLDGLNAQNDLSILDTLNTQNDFDYIRDFECIN